MAYGALPLVFEANQGQTGRDVKFLSRGSGYTLFLTPAEAVLSLRKGPGDGTVVRTRLLGSRPSPPVTGVEELPGKVNYFLGNNATLWSTNVPTYAKVKYESVYPGVDLVYYGSQRTLEYDFVVAPGADPKVITLAFEGPDTLAVDAEGSLILQTASGEVRLGKPLVYQETDGQRTPIAGDYILKRKNQVGFQVAAYDVKKPLVIDPVLSYSTYLGGSGVDQAFGIAVDGSGNAYVTGATQSANFIPPGVKGFDSKIGGNTDAFVTKLGPNGALVYSTYLGGGSPDSGAAIAVDSSGNAYVTGQTQSANFPITVGAFEGVNGGSTDAFVTVLNAAGSALLYSSFLGGNSLDAGLGIAVAPASVPTCSSPAALAATNIYVTGFTSSSNFPTTVGAFNRTIGGGKDAYVAKIHPCGAGLSDLVYSTLLSGSGDDVGNAIAVAGGFVYVTGSTASADFPKTPGAFDTTWNLGTDAFVAKLNPAGGGHADLVYSTFLGGTGDDSGNAIAVDAAANVAVTGSTNSSFFPHTPGAFQASPSGGSDAFVTVLNAAGSALLYSTYLGGAADDAGNGIAIAGGNILVTGFTNSAGSANSAPFPVTVGALQTTSGGGTDAFVTRLNPGGADTNDLVYSTFLGGSLADIGHAIAVDASGTVYVAGETSSTNFPGPSILPFGGLTDAFVVKLAIPAPTSLTVAAASASFGGTVSLSATLTAGGVALAGKTVSFTLNGAPVGSAITNASGVATLSNVSLTGINVGIYTSGVGASFAGDANFLGSSSSATLTVSQAATTTTLTVSPSAPVFGQSVTLTATVVAPGSGTPTGTVTFKDGTTTLGSPALSRGQASFTTTSLAVGAHSFSAVYSGDANFVGSSGVPTGGSTTVSTASTATAVTSSVNPSIIGQGVTFTAIVSVIAPGAGTPTGTVTFFDGGTSLGTAGLSGSQATFQTNTLAVGNHTITAQYNGDTNFAKSPVSAALSQTVNPSATTTTISASASSSTAGQAVTFTATVSATPPASGVPTGTVTFFDYSNQLGTSALDATGTATLTTNSLGVGLHSVTATYNGSASFQGSTSGVADSGILSEPVISAPTVLSTDRTSGQPLGALFVNCKSQFVTITGTGFLPPTTFPPNIGILFTLSDGVTVATGITPTEISFLTGTTLGVQVDVAAGVSGSFRIRVTNPDTGTGISAGTIVDVGNPQPCPAQGLAPSTTSSGTATPPVISSLVPSSGLRGSTVTINGSNFGAAPVVTFTGPGNTPVIATIKTTSTTALTVSVPAFPTNTADAFDGPVFVTNTGLASNGAAFTVTNPRLSVVTPSSAPPGLITLNLAGSKLQSGATVQFLNTGTTTPASGLTVNAVTSDGTGQHLTVAITATSATGLLDVVVTDPDSGSSKLVGGFQVKTPPAAGFTFSVNGADPAGYLPSVDGATVTLNAGGTCTGKQIAPHGTTLTATFVSANPTTSIPPGQVTFTIISSNLPGTATNEDCELVSPAASDFSISPIGAAVPTAPTVQQVTNVLNAGAGTYSVTLYSWDWGGNVTVSVSGVATVGGVANTTVTGTQALPVDTDGDKLPDAYEADGVLNSNAAGQNVLDRLNKDQNGNGIADGDDRFAADGLSNFEKYRGVFTSGPVNGGTAQMSGFTRLGAGLRHLFVRGRGFGNDPAIQTGTCGIDPSTGTPQPDPGPCPLFQWGPAFFAAGVQVHDVSQSFTSTTTFPRQSRVTPANAILDMATIVYDGVNCGGFGCSTSKTGARNWTFSSLGFSSYGTATAYGTDSRVTKKAVDAYFRDRPYQRRTAGIAACTASSTTPCFVLAPDGVTPMLTPLTLVGDLSNDSGVKDTTKEVVDASGQLLSDAYVAGSFNLQLSAMDANNDGCVELPFLADPRGIARCNPVASSALSPQATKQQVVRSLVTHELGHNIGINTHTTDSTDIMYQATNNWIREGHFSPTAAGLVQVHNKGGLQ